MKPLEILGIAVVSALALHALVRSFAPEIPSPENKSEKGVDFSKKSA